MHTNDEIERLAQFILDQCPLEIGADDPPDGESAVDVAIRLLGRMAEGIECALLELGVPGENYPAPVANAVELLQTALGWWGKP